MSNEKHRAENCLRFLNIDEKSLIIWSNKEDYARFIAGDDSVEVLYWIVESGADILIAFEDGRPVCVKS